MFFEVAVAVSYSGESCGVYYELQVAADFLPVVASVV